MNRIATFKKDPVDFVGTKIQQLKRMTTPTNWHAHMSRFNCRRVLDEERFAAAPKRHATRAALVGGYRC